MGGLGSYEVNSIVVGDCLDVMARLPDGCVDLVVTSPPYNNYENKRHGFGPHPAWRGRDIDYGIYDDRMPEKEYQKWQGQVIIEMLRVTKANGTVAYNHKNRIRNWGIVSPLSWIMPIANVRQTLIWNRKGSPQISPVRFLPNTERFYLLGEGRPFFNPKHLKDGEVWEFSSAKWQGIPSFPEDLVARLIDALCPENGLVADPFMGSGTTAVAADRLGRSFFGCDINPAYVEMGLERLRRDREGRAQLELW